MGTSCSYRQHNFEHSPQLILNNFDLHAYPMQINSKLYTHCPSKRDISKCLVQQSKEFIDDEILENNHSFSENLNMIENNELIDLQTKSLNKKDSLNSLNNSIKTETRESRKGILRPQSERRIQSTSKKRVRFYTKSKFVAQKQ